MSNSARRSAGIASRHSVKSVSNSAGAVTILFIAGASIRFPFTPPFRRPNRTPKKRGKISKKRFYMQERGLQACCNETNTPMESTAYKASFCTPKPKKGCKIP
jgi:hypothetical protein